MRVSDAIMSVCICVVSCYCKGSLCPRSLLLSALPAVSDRLQLLEQARLSKEGERSCDVALQATIRGGELPSAHQPGRPLGGQIYQGGVVRGVCVGGVALGS